MVTNIKRTSGFYAFCIHRTFRGEIRGVNVVGSLAKKTNVVGLWN